MILSDAADGGMEDLPILRRAAQHRAGGPKAARVTGLSFSARRLGRGVLPVLQGHLHEQAGGTEAGW